jgi:hypothetical protein
MKNPNPPYLYVYEIIKDALFVETPKRDLRSDLRDYARKLEYAAKLWDEERRMPPEADTFLSETDRSMVAHDWMLFGQKSLKTYASRLENLANSSEPVYRDSWNELIRGMLIERDKEIKRISFEKIQT